MIAHLIEKYGKDIEVQRATITTDSFGNDVLSWAKLRDDVAVVRQLSQDERYQNQQDTPMTTHRFYIALSDLTLQDRILFGAETFNITSIHDPMHMERFIQVDGYQRED